MTKDGKPETHMTKAGAHHTEIRQSDPTVPEATSTDSPPQPMARFLNQGSFADYDTALRKLQDWIQLAEVAGYPVEVLAAWFTVSDKVRVQLATRAYWKHLTPRGRAREALGQATDSPFVLCLVFQRGAVEALTMDELARLHAPLLQLGAPERVTGAA